MSTINQCTRAITGETKILQYYRLCITCSAVAVCLNCSAICHENHQLGPLLREHFSCTCHQITNCCRAIDPLGLAVSNSSIVSTEVCTETKNNKKRKLPSSSISNNVMTNTNTNTNTSTNANKVVVWSRMNNANKIYHPANYTNAQKDQANQYAEKVFFSQNPWKFEESQIREHDAFEKVCEPSTGHVRLKLTAEDDDDDAEADSLAQIITWECGVDPQVVSPPSPIIQSTTQKEVIKNEHEDKGAPAKKARTTKSEPKQDSATTNVKKNLSSFDLEDEDNENDMVLFTTNHPQVKTSTPSTTEQLNQYIHQAMKSVPNGSAKQPAIASAKKATKSRKEIGAPKGPIASYMIFSNQSREKVIAENPGLAMVEISREIGNRWKLMTAEEKQPFEELAKQDRERYAKEMDEFKRRKQEDPGFQAQLLAMAKSAKEAKPRVKRTPKAKPPADVITDSNENTTSTSCKAQDKGPSSSTGNVETTPAAEQKTKTKKPVSARSTKTTKSLIKSQVIEVDSDESDQDRMDISGSKSKELKAKDITDPSDEEVDESDENHDSDGSEETDLSGFIARGDVEEEEDDDEGEEGEDSDDESVDESNERSESSLFQEKKSRPNIPSKALKPAKSSSKSHVKYVGKYGSDDEYEFR